MPDDVHVVLLDVGGVLVSDYWETILLTPELGLADRLGLERPQVEEVGLSLWEHYCRRPADEATYWADLERALGVVVPPSLPQDLDGLVAPAPGADALLASMRDSGVSLGVISNNTAFWFPKQAARVGLDAYVDPELVFLSHEHGRTKGDEPSLFDVVAVLVDPSTALVVDDRPGNVDAARHRGFHAVRHATLPRPVTPADDPTVAG